MGLSNQVSFFTHPKKNPSYHKRIKAIQKTHLFQRIGILEDRRGFDMPTQKNNTNVKRRKTKIEELRKKMKSGKSVRVVVPSSISFEKYNRNQS